jgi:hypothetical protein
MTTISLPQFGTLIQGGYFHGVYQIGQELWGEVTAPKALGQLSGHAWLGTFTDVPGAASDFDGLANTQAMLDAGSPLAKAARTLRINGFDDWHIPARGGLLMQRSNLQPLLADDEAFDLSTHWSSTQFSRLTAYNQYFYDGDTYYLGKDWQGGLARAVRRFRIE